MAEITRGSLAVLGIAGSLRRGSYNRGLIRAAIESAPPGVTVTAHDLADLPMFNADIGRRATPSRSSNSNGPSPQLTLS